MDDFCVFIVKVQWNLCKLRGAEKLLTNLFGHNVKHPSSRLDVNWTWRWPIKTFDYPWRRLTTTSHDQLTSSMNEAGWSKTIHLRNVRGKDKYLHLLLTSLRWTILDQQALYTDEDQLILIGQRNVRLTSSWRRLFNVMAEHIVS